MDLNLTAEELEIIARAETLREDIVRPNADAWAKAGRIDPSAYQAAVDVGLTGMQIPKDKGGLGVSYPCKMRITEELAKGCMSYSFAMVNTHNVGAKLALEASDEIIADYVEDLRQCKIFGATALSEPDAGSDFSAIQTTAEKVDGGWRINGEKTWITNAAIADVFVMYAQTDAAEGWRGIACFLIDARRDGFIRSPQIEMFGANAIAVGGFKLDNYHAPDAHMLYPAGQAFKMALTSINGARTYVAAMCCGMVDDALTKATAYGKERQAFGAPILKNQGLRWMLADVATELEAARLLTYKAAVLVEQNAPEAILAAAHAKKYAARMAERSIPVCIQAMGANGLRAEHGLGRQLAAAKIAHYVDGSTEIQNDRIAATLFD